MLQIWDVNWYLDEAQCPCDVHFAQWLEEEGIEGATIFHFGTGGHHHLGLNNMARGAHNSILGITASPQEFRAFETLAIQNATLSRQYQVLFGDIYLLNERLLPRFDVASLFHLCEFRGESQDVYGGLTDRQVVEVLLKTMRRGGRILLFAGSFAYDKALAIADEFVAEGIFGPPTVYKSLRVYEIL